MKGNQRKGGLCRVTCSCLPLFASSHRPPRTCYFLMLFFIPSGGERLTRSQSSFIICERSRNGRGSLLRHLVRRGGWIALPLTALLSL